MDFRVAAEVAAEGDDLVLLGHGIAPFVVWSVHDDLPEPEGGKAGCQGRAERARRAWPCGRPDLGYIGGAHERPKNEGAALAKGNRKTITPFDGSAVNRRRAGQEKGLA
jgi:hypothetical protein